ncbi:MAG: glycosyltransferase [Acidobacteriota bacterium]
MSPAVAGPLAAGFLGLALWAPIALLILAGARRVRRLSEVLSPGGGPGPGRSPGRIGGASPQPSLSVVVTARDEGGRIEATVRRLLEQRYPGLRIIVVNDRSRDDTGAILERIRSEAGGDDSRLTVIHVRDLPRGWIGKCHACKVGALGARGDWILFTDGDVLLEEDDLLARVVAYAEDAGLDHVAVLPDLGPMPVIQAGLVAAFGQVYLLAARAHEMDRDLPRGGAGVGAFNLIRRTAYDRIGGHDLVRMDLADDFKLGRLLKESGARQRLFGGLSLVRCAWHRGALGLIRGLEKNLFGGFGFSLPILLLWTIASALPAYGPALSGILVSVLGGRSAGPIILLAAWMPFVLQTGLAFAAASEGPRHGGFRPAAVALAQPMSILLLLVAAWNSAIRTVARGGVVWRDTFYPLAELRAGLVPPGAGRRLPERRSPGEDLSRS